MDAFFKTGDRFIPPLGTQIKHAEVVQCFGIAGTKLQSFQQILVGAIAGVELRKDHAQAVVRFRILGTDSNCPLQRLAGFVPLLLLTVKLRENYFRVPRELKPSSVSS